MDLLGPDAEEHEVISKVEQAPRSAPANTRAAEPLLDLSPLLPLESEPMNLSSEEKQQRLADLLSSGLVTQGLGK